MASPGPILSKFLTVAFATVVVTLFSNRTTQAGCGDYLIIPGDVPHLNDAKSGFPPVSAPCQGPHCSASPAPKDQPVNLSSTNATSTSERDPAATSGQDWLEFYSTSPQHLIDSERGTVSRPSVPFHPPKTVLL